MTIYPTQNGLRLFCYYPTPLLGFRDSGHGWGWLIPAARDRGPWLQNWETGAGMTSPRTVPSWVQGLVLSVAQGLWAGHAHNTLAAFPGHISPGASQAQALLPFRTAEVTQCHFYLIL